MVRGGGVMLDHERDFQELLTKAIDVREQALYPGNSLFELPFDSKTEEVIQREQALLKCLLTQFNKMFEGV